MANLADINYQRAAVDLLKDEIDKNLVSHAYLFSGPKGCGKSNIARLFSAELIKTDFKKDDKRNTQDLIEKIQNDMFIDVEYMRCEGSAFYLIEQIRDLVEKTQYRPQLCQHKIFIIEEAEKLGTASANALLKTLEEPPNYVTIILLTNSIDNVLPTIVSRCQIVEFCSIPYDDCLVYVQKNSGCSRNEVALALDLFNRDTTKAINFCTDKNYIKIYKVTKEILKQIFEIDDWKILSRVEDIKSIISDICESRDCFLQDGLLEVKDTLSKKGFKRLEQQQKRQIALLKAEIASLIIQIIKVYYFNKIKDFKNDITLNDIKLSNAVIFYTERQEEMLRYNISLSVFLDALFLGIKETSTK